MQIHERKRLLKRALDEETPIPQTIRKDSWKLRELVLKDDITTAEPTTHIDDEYALAGFEDPRILLTTCHDPSQKLLAFAKELKLVFPNTMRMNRGSMNVAELVRIGRQHQFTDIIVVHETRGEPDGLIVQHLPYGPSYFFTLYNVITRHSIPKVGPLSQQYPHLVFENFSTKLGSRVKDGLRYLFPVVTNPETTTRVITFDNSNDYISFRNHSFMKDAAEYILPLQIACHWISRNLVLTPSPSPTSSPIPSSLVGTHTHIDNVFYNFPHPMSVCPQLPLYPCPYVFHPQFAISTPTNMLFTPNSIICNKCRIGVA
jgi:U3 small nucleolar ribonucleoprotein protein IMP4